MKYFTCVQTTCVSERLQKRIQLSLRMREAGWHLELQVWLQWSVFKELHSRKTPVPPRDSRHPPRDPSGRPACRPYVPWQPAQLSTSWLVRDDVEYPPVFRKMCLVALFPHCCPCALSAPSMQYSSSLACLTPELAELLLNHMSRERLLRPRTLELFFGCPLQKFVLNCYPYSTNELLRQLRAFTALKHLSLVNSPLITGIFSSQNF